MFDLLRSLCTPVLWVLALITLGLIFAKCLRKKPLLKIGLLLALLGVLVLYLFSIAPVSNMLVYSLECRYDVPPAEVLSTLDVVVILGGGLYYSGGFRQYPEANGVTYSRLFNGVRVFKQSGARTLALCGGSSEPGGESEAEVMKIIALELGVEEDEVIIETRSRNTMENAAELAKSFAPIKKKRIGLVTSALHMQRSEKAFRKQFPEATIVPIPVNYIYNPPKCEVRSIVPCAKALLISTYALHELIGIVWYSVKY